ncbi:MAG TPA: hypothetical protein VN605_05015, partial [Thermoanaerobaculia bacterium]|nr:hypothetical protein [Thermoanaerobaculia bacterium]
MRPSPFVTLLAIILVGNAGCAVYAAYGRPVSSLFLVLYYVGFATAVLWGAFRLRHPGVASGHVRRGISTLHAEAR